MEPVSVAMEANGRRRRRMVAAGSAAALLAAVLCFAAMTADPGHSSGGSAALLEQDLLSSTQREEMISVLRRKEDMAIKAAEARIKARMALKRASATHQPAPQQLHTNAPLHWAPTPKALKAEFNQFAHQEKVLEEHMHATQNTLNVIDHPALALQKQLDTLARDASADNTDSHHVQPVQKAAVVVQHSETPKARTSQKSPEAGLEQREQARIHELAEVADKERAMATHAEVHEMALEQEVNRDTEDNGKMQEELWHEAETVTLLNRAVAHDAELKQNLVAKEAELAKMSAHLDTLQKELRVKDAKAEAHAHLAHKAKTESSHEVAKQEFKSFAADEKAVVEDMHHVTAHAAAKTHSSVQRHVDYDVVHHLAHRTAGIPGASKPAHIAKVHSAHKAGVHIPGAATNVYAAVNTAHEEAKVPHATNKAYDNGSGYMKPAAPVQTDADNARGPHAVRGYDKDGFLRTSRGDEHAHSRQHGTHRAAMTKTYNGDSGYLKHKRGDEGDDDVDVKQAQATSSAHDAGKEEGNKARESQTQIVDDANKDASDSTLTSTKSKLESEMAAIEKSEDQALTHIKKKMSDLDDAGGGYVHTLIKDAEKASPDDDHPAEYHAKTQVLVAKPKKVVAAERRHAAAAVASTAKRAKQVAAKPQYVIKHAEVKREQEATRKSKGALSDDALNAVEKLARYKPEAAHARHQQHIKAHQEAQQKSAEEHAAAKLVHEASKVEHAAKTAVKYTAQTLAKAHTAKSAAASRKPAAEEHKQASKASTSKASTSKEVEAKAPLPKNVEAASAAAAHKPAVSVSLKPGAGAGAGADAAKDTRSSGSTKSAKAKTSPPLKQAKAATASKAAKATSASKAKAKANKSGSGRKEINPMAEISMALKAEKLFNTIGDGHHEKKQAAATPAAHTDTSAAHKTASAPAAAKVKEAARSSAVSSSDSSSSSSNAEIDPLSIVDKAFAKAKQAHEEKVVQEDEAKKAQLRIAASKRREREQALKKLNVELAQDSSTSSNTAASAPSKQLNGVEKLDMQVLASTKSKAHDEHANNAKKAAGGKHVKAAAKPAPKREMDPLAVIEEALVKEKADKQSGEPAAKIGGHAAASKPKPGSLLDLFGSKVAKSVGSLMDKVHKSEGRSKVGGGNKVTQEHASASKQKLKMSEVEKLAKMIEQGKIAGSKGKVHTARMEKEVVSSSQVASSSDHHTAHKKVAKAPPPRLSNGEIQEEKDKQAEQYLEALNKKDMLHKRQLSPKISSQADSSAAVKELQEQAAAKGSGDKNVVPLPHTQNAKDLLAQKYLENLNKAGKLSGKMEVGHNKMLKLFGKDVAKSYSHDKGFLHNQKIMRSIHNHAPHAVLKEASEGGSGTGSNWFSNW